MNDQEQWLVHLFPEEYLPPYKVDGTAVMEADGKVYVIWKSLRLGL